MKALKYFKKATARRILTYMLILLIILFLGYILFYFGAFVDGFNKEWDSK